MNSQTDKKVTKTISELKEWLDRPNADEDYTVYGINSIQENLNQIKIPKSIIVGFKSLDNWYSNNFVYELLTKQHTAYKLLASNNGLHAIIIADKLAQQYVNRPPSINFDKCTYWLSNCLTQKWYAESESVISIINNWLDSDCLKGGSDYKPASWFIIEVVNKGFGIDMNYQKYNYPEDMGVYQNALDNWDTVDLSLLDNIVSNLCEFHLNEASHGDLSDNAGKRDPMFLQFSSTKWFVYAFEILAWLSVRKKNGLINPEKFSHPLMNLELNKLSKESVPLPEDELFNKVMAKLNNG